MAGKKGKYELEIMIAGTTDKSLEAAIKKARGELGRLERSAGLSSKAVSDSFGGMSIRGIDNLAAISDKAFAGIKIAAGATAAGITAVLGASIAAGSGFEAQMSTVRAISGASEKDMERLTAIAEEMGRTTKFSATESGKGLEYMAMAGWKTEDMLNGLPGVMNLAAASGEELGTVSDIVTDAMTAFGMQANESARFADVLAQASASSNTNVAMMGETFQYVAPIAGSFGYIIEDVALATGLMANSGIKGEKAGTALRGMLTNLAKPTKQMRGYMEELKISLTDSVGEMKPFRDLLGELKIGFSGLTEAQKAEYAAGIAGKESMSGLLAMVNASDSDFEKLAESIDNSTGAAERMSEVQLDNLRGDLTLVKSAAEGGGIEIYNGLSEPLRDAAQWTEGWLNSFTENFAEDLPTIRREVLKFGTDLKKGFSPLFDMGEWFLEHPEVIKGSIMGIGAALLTFKAFKVAKDGILLLSKLSAAVTAWPVAAAGLAIGGIVGIGTAIQESERRAAEQNLAEHFGDITLSMEELNEAARNTLGEGLFNAIDEMGKASGKSTELYQSMQDNIRELNKANWKISLGIDFDESDEASYMQTVDSYVKNAQEYVSNKGYELKLAVDIIMGDSPDKQGLADGNNQFYQSLDEQINGIKEKMQSSLTRADEWGLSFEDKQKVVQKYLDDIAEVTQMISDAENSAKLQVLQGKYTGMDMTSPETFQNFQQAISEYTATATQKTDEAYEKVLTGLNAQRAAGEKGLEGGISQQVFDEQSDEATKRYYESKAKVITDGYETMKDTIMATYGAEIEPAMDEINRKLQEKIPGIMENSNSMMPEDFKQNLQFAVNEVLDSVEIPPDARMAIQALLEGMKPTEEQMASLKQQLTAAGAEVPQTILDAMSNMEVLGAVSGNETDLWGMIGKTISESPEHSLLLETVKLQGGGVPDAAMQAIEEKYDDAEVVAQGFLNVMRDTFQGGVNATVPVSIKAIMSVEGQSSLEKLQPSASRGKTPTHYASGGLIEQPTLSYFAENSPEMAIPIDGSNRSMELWQEAGRLLGAYEQNNYSRVYQTMSQSGVTAAGSSGGTFAPVFSPQIYYQGSASREDVEQSVQATYEQFVAWAEQLAGERSRAAF